MSNLPVRQFVKPPTLADIVNTKAHLRDNFFGPFEETFNRFFDDFFAVQRKPSSHGFPRVDVYEHDDKFVVEYSVAGCSPDDVKIQITEDPSGEFRDFGTRTLTVSGRMGSSYEHRKDAQYHVKELSRKHFSRTMILPDYVKTDPVASYRNGMLTLTFDLPKKEDPKSQVKTIEINVEDK